MRPQFRQIEAGGRLADGGVGVLSGVLGGMTGLGGNLPTIWCNIRGWPKDEQRAVFQPTGVAIFVGTALFLGGTGSITRDTIRLFLIGLPALLAGSWLGLKLYGELNEAGFRRVVLILLLVSGLASSRRWPSGGEPWAGASFTLVFRLLAPRAAGCG
jgi:uncharacterized membrane protein YfcA